MYNSSLLTFPSKAISNHRAKIWVEVKACSNNGILFDRETPLNRGSHIIPVIAYLFLVTNGEADTVILGTTLSNRHENRLMVPGAGHSTDTVNTCNRQSVGDTSLQVAISITSIIDAFKEVKLVWVWNVFGVKCIKQLDGDMCMPLNVSTIIQLLRSSIVGKVGV